MKELVIKLRNLIFAQPAKHGEEMRGGVKTVKPSNKVKPSYTAMTHGDRKRYFTNYNVELLNRISEIKSSKS